MTTTSTHTVKSPVRPDSEAPPSLSRSVNMTERLTDVPYKPFLRPQPAWAASGGPGRLRTDRAGAVASCSYQSPSPTETCSVGPRLTLQFAG